MLLPFLDRHLEIEAPISGAPIRTEAGLGLILKGRMKTIEPLLQYTGNDFVGHLAEGNTTIIAGERKIIFLR